MTNQELADLKDLLDRPQFLRFVYRMIERSGLFSVSIGEGACDPLFVEGRRSSMMEVLQELERAQPLDTGGLPILTLIQTLREAAQSATKEKPGGGKRGIYGELGSGDGNDASG